MKYQLEHKGTIVASSDWSNILFSYVRNRPAERQGDYFVRNVATGAAAGLVSK